MENNNGIQSYAGFTIGPIYDVLSSAKKTKELWFASYFFSWFMEKLAQNLSRNNQIEFITPFVEKPFKESNSLTGKYHDRFIVYSTLDKETLFDIINEATKETLGFFVSMVDELVNSGKGKYINGYSKGDVEKILSWYIQRNFVVIDSSQIGSRNVINFINQLLDSMEENRSVETGINEKTCFMCKTLPAIIKAKIYVKEKESEETLCPMCFLKYFALSSNETKKKINKENFRFPSLVEISASDLLTEEVKKRLEINKQEGDIEFETIINAYKDSLHDKENNYFKKDFLKYFAVIHADGDNIGKILNSLNDLKSAKEFSKRLFDFASEAEKIIKSYKGYPIYIGGDDILALTPVAATDDNGEFKNVFGLSKDLSDKYNKIIQNQETTLSIGVNIVYHKFPLSIALKDGRHELFEVAKEVKEKNALAVAFTKHSGSKHEITFKFGTNEIELFSKLLNDVLSGKIVIPQSIYHNLSRFKALLSNITTKEQLSYFFENNFNEPIHRKDFKEGIEEVRNYIEKSLFSYANENRSTQVEQILLKLKFIKFLMGEE